MTDDDKTGPWLCMCLDCHPHMPMPFSAKTDRDEWRHLHQTGTGHNVVIPLDFYDGVAIA